MEEAILQVVGGYAGIKRKDLKNRVQIQLKSKGIKGSGVHKIEETIDQLHKSGKLKMEIGYKGAKQYSLHQESDAPEAKSLTDLQPLKNSA